MTSPAPTHAFAVPAALTALDVALDEPVVADAAPAAVEPPVAEPEAKLDTAPLMLREAVTESSMVLLTEPAAPVPAVEVAITTAVPLAVVTGAEALRADVQEEYADAEAET